MRADKIFSNVFLALSSVILTFVILELGANYYLWNNATIEQFNYYASINQFKERYGQDFLIQNTLEEDSDVSGGTRFYPHPYLGYVGTPNWFDNRDPEQPDYHDSFGFRSPEVTREKPEGVYRIIAIGASTTYGTKVEYEYSYPYLLQEYLREAGYDNVEVMNMGVGGYTSFESLINLQFNALDFDPDLIIIYHGSNDTHARLVVPPEAYRGDNTGYRAPIVQNTRMPALWEHSTLLRILGIEFGVIESHSSLEWTRWRRADTAVGDEYREQYRQYTYPSGIFTEVSGLEIIEQNPPIYFERNTRNMILSAQGEDADVLLVTYVLSDKFNEPQTRSDVYVRAMEEHNAVTRQLAEETGAYLFDLAPIFPDDIQNFTDGRHMTAEGNQLRSQMIGDYIIDMIFAQTED